jgi:hypothetical protein
MRVPRVWSYTYVAQALLVNTFYVIGEQIIEVENFCDLQFAANIIRKLHDRRELWEARTEKSLKYRKGDFYTMGANLYIDGELALKDSASFIKKVEYWNGVMSDTFPGELYSIAGLLERDVFKGKKVQYVADFFPIGLPGFHIFTGFETGAWFFGNEHQDQQWKPLLANDLFKRKFQVERIDGHFSLTLPLKLPYTGGGLLIGEGLKTFYQYKERAMYHHSGQFNHAIAPIKWPVLPTDERISLQAHGFFYKEQPYLYW